MTEAKDINLYQRILGVMADLKSVHKGGKTPQYKFVTHDAVTSAIHPLLVRHGIVALPSIHSHNQEGNRTELVIKLKLINADNPEETVETNALGYGVDNQDKGPGKAYSYAVKMAYLKVFCLESGEMDIEDDATEHAVTSMEQEAQFIEIIASGDHMALHRFTEPLGDAVKMKLFRMLSSDGKKTAREMGAKARAELQ